jgi:hypothetical protein
MFLRNKRVVDVTHPLFGFTDSVVVLALLVVEPALALFLPSG